MTEQQIDAIAQHAFAVFHASTMLHYGYAEAYNKYPSLDDIEKRVWRNIVNAVLEDETQVKAFNQKQITANIPNPLENDYQWP